MIYISRKKILEEYRNNENYNEIEGNIFLVNGKTELTSSQIQSIKNIRYHLKQFYNQIIYIIIIYENKSDYCELIIISEPDTVSKFITYYRRDVRIGRQGGLSSRRIVDNKKTDKIDNGDISSLSNFIIRTKMKEED